MNKKLYCSPDKKLCGVCGGIADYFNIDPTIIRIAVTVIAIYTAVIPALIAYFVMALIIPKPPENYYQLYNNTSKRITKGHDKKIAGVCSGFAERFDFDPTIVRILFVLLVLAFGTGILAYIACALLMPPCADYDYNRQYGAPYNQYQGGQYQNNPYQNGSYQGAQYQNGPYPPNNGQQNYYGRQPNTPQDEPVQPQNENADNQ